MITFEDDKIIISVLKNFPNQVVTEIEIHPEEIDLDKIPKLKNFSIDDAIEKYELYFSIPQITINKLTYVRVMGCIAVHEEHAQKKVLNLDIFSGVKKEYKDLPSFRLKAKHQLTKKAVKRIEDDINVNFINLLLSNWEDIYNQLIHMTRVKLNGDIELKIANLKTLQNRLLTNKKEKVKI